MRWWRRQYYFLGYALSSLWRRRGQALTVLVVHVLLVGILASVVLFTRALKRESDLLFEGENSCYVQHMQGGRQLYVPAQWLQEVSSIRGVSALEGRLWGYYFDPLTQANYTLMATDGDDLRAGEVVLGAGVQRVALLRPGDSISFRAYNGMDHVFEVRRVLEPEVDLVAADMVLMREDSLRALYGLPPGVYSDLVVTIPNPAESVTIARKIQERLPGARPMLQEDLQRSYRAMLDWRGGLSLFILSAAVLSFLILAWDRAGTVHLKERQEIATLKSLGWSVDDLMRWKQWECFVLAGLAYVLGLALAIIHIGWFDGSLLRPVLRGWSVIYPAYQPALVPAWPELLLIGALAVIPYLLASLVPIWRLALLDPGETLR